MNAQNMNDTETNSLQLIAESIAETILEQVGVWHLMDPGEQNLYLEAARATELIRDVEGVPNVRNLDELRKMRVKHVPKCPSGTLAETLAVLMDRLNMTEEERVEVMGGGADRSPRAVALRSAIAHELYRTKGPGGLQYSWPEVSRAMGVTNHSSVIIQGERFAAFLEVIRDLEAKGDGT